MKRKLSAIELRELLSLPDNQQDKYLAELEEQDKLYRLYEEQEKRLAIQRAVVLLEENGYKVEKIS